MTKKKENPNQSWWLNIGVKAIHLKERSIEQCLNCEKPECTGCTIWEKEKPEVKL